MHNDTYQLRSNDRKLYLNKPNTNFMKNSFSYRGAVSWNSLPAEIVDVYDQLSSVCISKQCICMHKRPLENQFCFTAEGLPFSNNFK
jgi:hypothetical protein